LEDPGSRVGTVGDTLTEDLQNAQVPWTEDADIAGDRATWKSCVAQ